jgi:hypothetical protein
MEHQHQNKQSNRLTKEQIPQQPQYKRVTTSEGNNDPRTKTFVDLELKAVFVSSKRMLEK